MERRTKRTAFLAVFLTLAMLVTAIPTNLQFTKVFTNDADATVDMLKVRLEMRLNGNPVTRDTIAYVAGGTVTFAVIDQNGNDVTSQVTIKYTTSDTDKYGAGGNGIRLGSHEGMPANIGYTLAGLNGANNTMGTGANAHNIMGGGGGAGESFTIQDPGRQGQTTLNGIPVGVAKGIADRQFARHAGGIVPQNGATYSTGITIPALAEGTRDIFVVSAAITDAPWNFYDYAPVTQSFILLGKGFQPDAVGDSPGGAGTAPDDWTGGGGSNEGGQWQGTGTPGPSFAATTGKYRTWAWANHNYLIFSIYTDAYNLYDHYDGILVPGADREEWIKAYRNITNLGTKDGKVAPPNLQTFAFNADNAKQSRGAHQKNLNYPAQRTRPDFVDFNIMEVYAPTLPANYERKGRGGSDVREGKAAGGAETEAHVEAFTGDGHRVIAQSAGLRMKGGWSRGTYQYEQRTFEFYARKGYTSYSGVHESFEFPLFGLDHVLNGSATGKENMISEYSRFRVRNGGSDRDGTYMRDEFGSTIARQSGYMHPQNFRPGAVFLNGAYYGLTMVKSPRTENHWDRMYGGKEKNFHIHTNGERGTLSCFSVSCGRVPDPTLNAGTFHESNANQQDLMQTAGPGSTESVPARRYWATRPYVCNSDNVNHQTNHCQGDRLARCKSFWSEPNDICAIYSETKKAGCNDYSNPNYGSWECLAKDDWANIKALVTGEAIKADAALGWDAYPEVVYNGTKGSQTNPVGLTDPARWAEFQRRVDIDTIMHYYALEMYIANMDWPGNNLELWRYFPDGTATRSNNNNATLYPERTAIADGSSELHPYLKDEKWRFVANDLEMGYSIFSLEQGPASSAAFNTIAALIVRDGQSGAGAAATHYGAGTSTTYMMRALLGDDEARDGEQIAVTPLSKDLMRGRLANALSDIMEGAFSEENALNVFNSIQDSISYEHQVALSTYSVNDGSIWGDYGRGGETGNTASPLPNRRIAEIHRGSTIDGIWQRYSWPRWENNPDGMMDATYDEHNRIRTFLGSGEPAAEVKTAYDTGGMIAAIPHFTNNTIVGTNNPNTRYGGRHNTSYGMPKHIEKTFGSNFAWGNRYSVNFSVEGPYGGWGGGDAIMNTRPVAVRDTKPWGYWDNAASVYKMRWDPRAEGRAVATDVNGTPVPTSVVGKYYPGTEIKIKANPDFGMIAQWEGATPDANDPNTVTVSAAATIKLKFVRDDAFLTVGGNLRIGDVKATAYTSNGEDWVSITNPTNRAISTKGMYLTDDNDNEKANVITKDNRFKCPLPGIIIRGGDTVTFKTENNTTTKTLKRAVLNFNVGFNERLRLTTVNNGAWENTVQGPRFGKVISRTEVGLMGPSQIQTLDGDGRYRIRIFGASGKTPGTFNKGYASSESAPWQIVWFPDGFGPELVCQHGQPMSKCSTYPCNPCPNMASQHPTQPTSVGGGKVCLICNPMCPHGIPMDQIATCLICSPPASPTAVGTGGANATNVTKNGNAISFTMSVPSDGAWTITIYTTITSNAITGWDWQPPHTTVQSVADGVVVLSGNGSGGWGNWSQAGITFRMA